MSDFNFNYDQTKCVVTIQAERRTKQGEDESETVAIRIEPIREEDK